jgi:hypothetical protein
MLRFVAVEMPMKVVASEDRASPLQNPCCVLKQSLFFLEGNGLHKYIIGEILRYITSRNLAHIGVVNSYLLTNKTY